MTLTSLPTAAVGDPDPRTAPTLTVVPWPGPGEPDGFDPRSRYVETFWLPVLGPSATWLLRMVADRLEKEPDGFELDPEDAARRLGLGGSGSRHSPLPRALARAVAFGAARRVGPGAVAFRPRLGSIPARRLLRLPLPLQEEHRVWAEASVDHDGRIVRRRARLVALDLRELGMDDAGIERHLLRRGVHPATAFEAARWAWSAGAEDDRDVDPTLAGRAERRRAPHDGGRPVTPTFRD